MIAVTRERPACAYDRALPPVATVEPGATVLVETHDARGGRLLDQPPGRSFALPDPEPGRSNPLTGPIAVRGARPGDALTVRIDGIEVAPVGWCGALAGVSPVAPGRIPRSLGRTCAVEGATERLDGARPASVRFADGVVLDAAPMVGCLGVAPADGAPGSIAAGRFGGNHDQRPVASGALVRLPVLVDEALLFVGDVHAAQGDGELSGFGLEIAATVTLTVDLEPGSAPDWPWVETADRVMVLTAAPTFEGARDAAVAAALDAIEAQLRLEPAEALVLLSLAGDLRIGQAFGAPEVTVRLELPAALGVRPTTRDEEAPGWPMR